ncbi:MAG: diguanylate cyclase [Actinomycetia bacterium]|nr:diguanylate cyclase [Actinomycetes bacterium]
MTLRTRLALVLVALVLVPLVAAAILVLYAVPRAAADRADTLVLGARSGVTNEISQTCELAQSAAVVTGRMLGSSSPATATRRVVADGLADWVSVVDDRGNAVSSAGQLPGGLITQPWSDCAAGEAGGPALSTELQVVVADTPRLSAVRTADAVNAAYLDDLRARLGFTADVVLLIDGRVVASTTDQSTDLSEVPTLAATAPVDGGLVSANAVTAAVAPAGPGMPFDVVVATPTPGGGVLVQTVFLVALVSLVVAVVAAVAIARDLTGPLEEVTDAAEAVASGDLTKSIEVRRSDEVGRLARAFNHMTDELLTYVTELEGSRDALRANFDRLGEALSATLDLETLVPVVLETAMTSVGAEAGVVMLGDEHGGLTLHAEHGMRTRSLTVPSAVVVGDGLLGAVAASGLSVRGELGSGPELQPSANEPQTGSVLAVPLRRPPHVFGVIALFAPTDPKGFDAAAESSLQALAGPASIAVENVLLHAEATRASTIDQMTGVWNYRYLLTSLNREVERALRFDRSLSVLMLDLDHFKLVNDAHGHPRGDAVLREFASRVQAEIREVDTLARYGGEEFAVVLPETTATGAENLAQRICAAIRSQTFTGDESEAPVSVTVSIGGAVYPEHGGSSRELIQAADRALYSAKAAGRNRWAMAVASERVADR